MSFLNVAILGAVQGLTEFLPISSSGHLLLIQSLFPDVASPLFLSVMLHLGSLFAVFIAFYQTIFDLFRAFFGLIIKFFQGQFRFTLLSAYERMVLMLLISLLPLLLVYPLIKNTALYHMAAEPPFWLLGLCFCITSVFLFVSDGFLNGKTTENTLQPGQAILVGVAQCVALFPGISRSGTTLFCGLACGLERSFAVVYSFILGIPTVLGAVFSEGKEALKNGNVYLTGTNLPILLFGMLISAIFGLLSIRFVTFLTNTRKFKGFSLYALLLGIFLILNSFLSRPFF